jgi:two-component sensor histidine kinase
MNKHEVGGEIVVLMDPFGDNITCTIVDNGVGRKKSAEINQKKNRTHKSMGTSITQNRVELINSIYKKNITIEYDDPTDENGKSLGTIVKIIFNK